mmetsp:Transcript_5645/g.10542  ORF Transcript_5645/g.10542 Transcript_5645/m.10542 type:complete len:263 (-) Transcript_5645:69-857(-)
MCNSTTSTMTSSSLPPSPLDRFLAGLARESSTNSFELVFDNARSPRSSFSKRMLPSSSCHGTSSRSTSPNNRWSSANDDTSPSTYMRKQQQATEESAASLAPKRGAQSSFKTISDSSISRIDGLRLPKRTSSSSLSSVDASQAERQRSSGRPHRPQSQTLIDEKNDSVKAAEELVSTIERLSSNALSPTGPRRNRSPPRPAFQREAEEDADAVLGEALISTIERLSVRAALAMTSPKSSGKHRKTVASSLSTTTTSAQETST